MGELSLNGELRPVRGALALALGARADGIRGVLLPQANAAEAAVVQGVEIIPVGTLVEAVEYLTGERAIVPAAAPPTDLNALAPAEADLSEVRGQPIARLGRWRWLRRETHNLLLLGPPGSGKTMLARRLPGILPPMVFEESLEVTEDPFDRGADWGERAGVDHAPAVPIAAPHNFGGGAGRRGCGAASGGSEPGTLRGAVVPL